jgi:opacity protein-like surface antigen
MRRKLMGLAAAALLTAVTAQTATAQARGYVGFGAGLALPVGDFKEFAKTGWLGQVIAGVTGASGMIGGRIDGNYIRNSFKGTGGTHSTLIGANLDLVWTPGKRPAKVHPYLLGGIGVFNAKESGTSDGVTKFAFNAGAGVQVHLGNRMDFYGEARYLNIRTEDSTSLIPIVIGLRWGGI